MKNLLLLLLLALSISLFSQRVGKGGRAGNLKKPSITYSLFGQVLDDRGKGLPYVSVAFFYSKDSNYVKGSATEANGRFTVQVP